MSMVFAGALLAWCAITWPSALFLLAPTSWMEAYLRGQTPLGSEEPYVRRWLAHNGSLFNADGLPRVGPPSRLMVMDDSMLDPKFVYTYDEAIVTFDLLRAVEVRAAYTFKSSRTADQHPSEQATAGEVNYAT